MVNKEISDAESLQHTMGELAARIVDSLSRHFWNEVVDLTDQKPVSFMEAISELLQQSRLSADALAAETMRRDAEPSRPPFLIYAAYTAGAYALETMMAANAGSAAQAWRHYAEARHWQGVTITAWHFCKSQANILQEMKAHIARDVSNVRRERLAEAGKKGADQRNKPFDQIKEWALGKVAAMGITLAEHRNLSELSRRLERNLPPHIANASDDPRRVIYDALLSAKRAAGAK